MLQRLLYLSEIAPGILPLDVQRIQWVSSIRNRRLDLTGMLAVTHRHFAQVLEGTADRLLPVLARIERDGRHARVRVLAQETVAQRCFGKWSMGLIDRYDLSDEAEQLYQAGHVEPQSLPGLFERFFLNPV